MTVLLPLLTDEVQDTRTVRSKEVAVSVGLLM